MHDKCSTKFVSQMHKCLENFVHVALILFNLKIDSLLNIDKLSMAQKESTQFWCCSSCAHVGQKTVLSFRNIGCLLCLLFIRALIKFDFRIEFFVESYHLTDQGFVPLSNMHSGIPFVPIWPSRYSEHDLDILYTLGLMSLGHILSPKAAGIIPILPAC